MSGCGCGVEVDLDPLTPGGLERGRPARKALASRCPSWTGSLHPPTSARPPSQYLSSDGILDHVCMRLKKYTPAAGFKITGL